MDVLAAKVDRINAGGSVPPWDRHLEWDDTGDKRQSVDEGARITSPTEGSDKRRLGCTSPTACLSQRMLVFSELRSEARRRRVGQLQEAITSATKSGWV